MRAWVHAFAILLLTAAVPLPAQTSAEAVFAEAEALSQKGDPASMRAAVDRLLEARRLFQLDKKPAREASVLLELGGSYYLLRDFDQALKTYQEMSALCHNISDPKCEGRAIKNIGDVKLATSQFPEAIGHYEQALAVNHDPQFQADVLSKIGAAWMYRADPRKALSFNERAVAIFRKLNEKLGLAQTLFLLAQIHESLSEYDAAAGLYLEALPIFREQNATWAVASTLANLGLDYRYLSRYETSIQYAEQAAAAYRQIDDKKGEAAAMITLGSAYSWLNDADKAIEYWNKALNLYRQTNDIEGQASALNNLASSYQAQEQSTKALELYEQSLALLRTVSRSNSRRKLQLLRGEGKALGNLGEIHVSLGEYAKGFDYYQQALSILREVGDKQAEGVTLSNLGAAYLRAGDYDKAISYDESAIAILRAMKDRRGEAIALSNIMDVWSHKGRPQIAAFFGKQSVNLYQEIRGDIKGLSQDLQKSYTGGNEPTYRMLADLLIGQGRLAEAQRTLHLLKDEEFFAFVRSDKSVAGASGRVELTPEEAEWSRKIDEYRVAVGQRRGELAKKERTPAEEEQLAGYDKLLMPGNADFQRYLEGLASQAGSKPASAVRIHEINEAEALMADLAKLPAGTVAIYTLSGEDKYRAILVTPDVQKAYEYPISAADLNRKVLQFREAIETPQADPRPRAKELFDILIGPKLRADLRQAKAETLMWSLDGTLRYVPLAALYDGSQYLVEQFRIEVFTPSSHGPFNGKPSRTWKAAEFGVTKAHGDFPALDEVAGELHGVSGVLAGDVLLDERFTSDSILNAMRQHYQVIHIASHFNFKPGDETSSFLLLGDGGHLTLEALKAFPKVSGLDLLTLSACNTGMGGSGEQGKEVEGLAILAQKKGAQAVLASLWEVSDESTSLLMQTFYQRRQSSDTMTKAQALREAQLAMLHGKLKRTAPAKSTSRGMQPSWKQTPEKDLPRFPANADAPFAHPYYWAPFFLIGNWL